MKVVRAAGWAWEGRLGVVVCECVVSVISSLVPAGTQCMLSLTTYQHTSSVSQSFTTPALSAVWSEQQQPLSELKRKCSNALGRTRFPP